MGLAGSCWVLGWYVGVDCCLSVVYGWCALCVVSTA